MLFDLIRQVGNTIEKIDPMGDAPAFVDSWLEHRPEQREMAFSDETDPEARETVFQMFAAGALTIVKRMPEMMDVMAARLSSSDEDPAVQCALATVLAYVAQPRDLIPDDAPGGYGFVDDAILLHAGFLDILSLEPPHAERFKTQEEYLSFISSFAPLAVMEDLRCTVESLESTLAVFRMLPSEALELTTRIILEDPYRVVNLPIVRKEEFRSGIFLEQVECHVDRNVTRDGDRIVVQCPGVAFASGGSGRTGSGGRDFYRV